VSLFWSRRGTATARSECETFAYPKSVRCAFEVTLDWRRHGSDMNGFVTYLVTSTAYFSLEQEISSLLVTDRRVQLA